MTKTLRSRGHRALIDLLVEAREMAGLSQAQLGDRLNRPQSYIGKVETGERGIDPIECRAWAKACGMRPRKFWYRLERILEARP